MDPRIKKLIMFLGILLLLSIVLRIYVMWDSLFLSWDMILLPLIVLTIIVLFIVRLSFFIRFGLLLGSVFLTILFVGVLVLMKIYPLEAFTSILLPIIVFIAILCLLVLMHLFLYLIRRD